MISLRSLAPPAVAVLASLSLTACGSDAGADFAAQSAEKIEAQVLKDMKTAKSLRVTGSITNDGKAMSLDLAVDTEGNCTGTIGQEGAEAEVLSVDGQSYLKGDDAFWKATTGPQADKVIAVLNGRWALLPSGSDEFSEFCDLDKLLEELIKDEDDSKVTKGEVGEVDGQESLELISEDEDGTARAQVATEGKHYFLEISPEGDEEGSMKFTDYDEPVDAKAPAKDDVVDLSSLG